MDFFIKNELKIMEKVYLSGYLCELLKERGFNSYTLSYFIKTDVKDKYEIKYSDTAEDFNSTDNLISRPTIFEVLAWLNRNHIDIFVKPNYEDEEYCYISYIHSPNKTTLGGVSDYVSAFKEAISYVIKCDMYWGVRYY